MAAQCDGCREVDAVRHVQMSAPFSRQMCYGLPEGLCVQCQSVALSAIVFQRYGIVRNVRFLRLRHGFGQVGVVVGILLLCFRCGQQGQQQGQNDCLFHALLF